VTVPNITVIMMYTKCVCKKNVNSITFYFIFLADTVRAISLMEDYCSKLKKPEEQKLKTAILRVTGIFKSSLFQALIGKLKFAELFL